MYNWNSIEIRYCDGAVSSSSRPFVALLCGAQVVGLRSTHSPKPAQSVSGDKKTPTIVNPGNNTLHFRGRAILDGEWTVLGRETLENICPQPQSAC